MRSLIVDTCYPAFLRDHYEARPGLRERSYDEQWRALMDTFFGTADSYSYHLGIIGHEANEVVANCAPMQLAWAREHGLRLGRWAWQRQSNREAVVLAQAEELRPDIVYVQDLHFLGLGALARLRSLGSRVVGQIASAPPLPRKLRAFELVLTSFPHYVSAFRRLGVRSEYLRIGFDKRVLSRLEHDPPGSPGRAAVFVGALNRRRHRTGNAIIAEAAARAPVDFWGYGARGWSADSPVRRNYRGEAWGLDMYRALRAAPIAINRHIREAGDFANNMRLYEATGVGTMLITDAKRNLSELFAPGREVVTYTTPGELADAVNHYLAQDEEREAIARAGQARTLGEHTYRHRMEELVSILEQSLP
ncbi:MAG: glycosyltransferase family 1 protein [Actinobacteria bacterium]|nr:glycosyltransferase family 1 protein [Actinomycetota bacterium]